MKIIKFLGSVLLIFATISCSQTIPLAATGKEVRSPSGLTTQLSSDRDTCLPGEPVTLTLRVGNRTSSPILVYRAFKVSYGRVWVRIASEDGPYKLYLGSGFGTADGTFQLNPMKPGEEMTVSFRVLYHHVSKASEELPANYAFGSPGTYSVKATLYNIVPGHRRIHTEPIRIRIAEPEGTDETVWNLLQTKGAAYFLHRGWPLSADEGMAEEFERIIARYPDSTYTPHIQETLDRFRSRKRKGRSSRPMKADIVEAGGQTFMVRTVPGGGGRSGKSHTQKDIDEIVRLTDSWVAAYNAGDLSRMMRHVTLRSLNREQWDRGSEWERKQVVRDYR